MIVTWKSNVPDKVRELIEPLIAARLHRLPTLLHEFIIEWDSVHTGSDCQMTVRGEYRWAMLTIFSSFLDVHAFKQAELIDHEFTHVLIDPLCELIDRLVDLTENEPLKKMIQQQKRIAMESVCCDVARAMSSPQITYTGERDV